jgi:hypothetical protein
MGSPFTSARNGLWDASDVDTWGQGAGVYPQTAADVVNIGHTVTYNKVSTTEMGLITITNGGILTFLNSMSTKLTLGHVEIAVSNGGELRVGASGAIIPKQYTAELIWNTTADNAKGINLAAGGKLTAYGDPDYFGSDCDTVLISSSGAVPAAGNSITITVAGDFTTKWVAGQELLMHKGGTYASYINDFCRLAIVSVAANGANTDVACTVTERPAALTCATGADVLNLSRNVMFYKLSYNANLGQQNTNRPRVTSANVTGTTNYNVHDVSFGGWFNIILAYGNTFEGVVRNGQHAVFNAKENIVSGIFLSCYSVTNLVYFTTVSGYYCGMSVHCFGGTTSSVYTTMGCSITGKAFGNYLVLARVYGKCTNLYMYGNAFGATVLAYLRCEGGSLGVNNAGTTMANTYDLLYSPTYIVDRINSIFTNMKLATVPPSSSYRNTEFLPGRFSFEHCNQVAGDHYAADAYADIYKVAADGSGDNPSQRSGGGVSVAEIVPQSLISSVNYVELFNIRLWAAAGESKTYRFYVQTDYATLPTAELKLYGEYMDNSPAGTGHLATVQSTQGITTRANAADWSQYVEVTINPATAGWVNLYLRLMGYESTKKVWVDPMAVIS